MTASSMPTTWRQEPVGRLFLEAAASSWVVDTLHKAALQRARKFVVDDAAVQRLYVQALAVVDVCRQRGGGLPSHIEPAARRRVAALLQAGLWRTLGRMPIRYQRKRLDHLQDRVAMAIGLDLEAAGSTSTDPIMRRQQNYQWSTIHRDSIVRAAESGTVPAGLLPRVHGSPEQRQRYATELAASLEGEILRVAAAWCHVVIGSHPFTMDSNPLRDGVDDDALRLAAFGLECWRGIVAAALTGLTGVDLADVQYDMSKQLMYAARDRKQISAFLPAPLVGEAPVIPFGASAV